MDQAEELVEVFSTNDANEAEVLRVALEGEGVRCQISGKSQAGLVGVGIMEVKLLVRAADAERARAYLESDQDGDEGQ